MSMNTLQDVLVLFICIVISNAQLVEDIVNLVGDSVDTKIIETAVVDDPDNRTNFNSGSENDTWVQTAVRDIAYYLRAHKFNEFDRRFFIRDENVTQKFYTMFPDPPLRTLHWEVKKFCILGFLDCIQYLQSKIEQAELHRTDDTVAVMIDQNWSLPVHKTQIDNTDEECHKLHKLDWIGAQPFLGPLERFQWRTSASYFMCWFTMNKVKALAHFGEPCDNFADCLDPWYGPFNADVRANDSSPYSCAAYSFCPDPCCPQKHIGSWDVCWNDELNPCYSDAPADKRQCLRHEDQNINLVSIILNQWNVSCFCDMKGYEWNSKFGMCVDINECTRNLYSCNKSTEACINTAGSYMCICKWTYLYNTSEDKCVLSDLLMAAEIEYEEKIVNKTDSKIQLLLSYIVPDAIQDTEFYNSLFNKGDIVCKSNVLLISSILYLKITKYS